MKEMYRKYRPKTFDDVLGQESAVKTLTRKWETDTLPHSILLHGPYGTGKTTLARIVARCLKCDKYDFTEKNSANYRGIDEIRNIRNTVNQAPIGGPVRVWLLDEIHKATNDAQNAMLKLLEDPPDHAYFILATTEPDKLLAGIKQRCLSIKLNPISDKGIYQIVKKVCSSEKIKLSKSVVEKLVEHSGGAAREALQILDRIYQLDDADEQIEAIEKTSIQTQAIQIARMLISTKSKWRDMAAILRELQNEDPERIRYMILGYGKSVLLSKDNPRAYRMIDVFSENFYDSKFAGVVAACYEILQE